MLSGIGAADELAEHNIEVVQDLPGVGKNLQDHVDCVMAYECREPVTLYSDLRADKLTLSVIQGMLFGKVSPRPSLMRPGFCQVARRSCGTRYPAAFHACA
ncbi:GMC family oxidoreductase N-terminal domain-containing protein [Brucella pituitosa]|uniref:GMC family oxidoreductase N-terminal domain-containing protein n=1 Tax=Brucella pituitosa TaxID=571256 RepID=UPI0020926865|nr:GMC family oxidoreductase N-terminal domain-containing protein [Brucella pituitosa]